MKKIIYYILYALVYIFSLIPLRILYLFTDIVWLLMYLCPPLRYRRKIVRKNLVASFPEKSLKQIRSIERRFYRNFLDQILESLKVASMSERWIERHVEIVNYEKVREQVASGHSVMVYMGHMGNWEWIPSLGLKFKDMEELRPYVCQIYHRLQNPVTDMLMLKLREKYGAISIPMALTYRQLLEYRNEGKTFIVGMIADQVPLWWNIRYWTYFMNQYTPVFTGAERIARKIALKIYYGRTTRKSRGYYRYELIPMYESEPDAEPFAITEKFTRLLEEDIIKDPPLWLWTHNRWKRTWEGFQEWLAENGLEDKSIGAR